MYVNLFHSLRNLEHVLILLFEGDGIDAAFGSLQELGRRETKVGNKVLHTIAAVHFCFPLLTEVVPFTLAGIVPDALAPSPDSMATPSCVEDYETVQKRSSLSVVTFAQSLPCFSGHP